MIKTKDYEITDYGIEHEQYFQGHGMKTNKEYPGLLNYTGPNEGWFLFIHHETILEYSKNIAERVAYIKENKPVNERPVRLQALRVAPVKFVGQAYSTASQAYSTASQAYITARQACDTARQACDTARQAYLTARQAYSTASQACDTAWQACDTAWLAYITARQAYSTASQAYSTASQAYITARQACNTASQAYDTAWLKKNFPKQAKLWNGKSLIFKK